MNKTAIKKFAVESRQKLIKSVIECLEELGITDKEVVELVELGGVYTVKSKNLTEIEKKNRDIIIKKIQDKGYKPFVEEVAYTWFNRIIAIRYMELKGYLPFKTRVLSSEVPGKVDPDIITEITDHIDELDLNRDKVIELKEHNKQEELFKYVFIKVCNYLGQFLPVMFEKIENYTELLLPSLMISKGSVIKEMIDLVPEEDWVDQVEIIGWLYQYYNEDRKNEVINIYKGTVKKEDIPAATQLFTTDWVVRYMVDNSLGRYWIERHPESTLKDKLEFFVTPKNGEIKFIDEEIDPKDLTFLDPCMGSGHILVYAFDVLMNIYTEYGYSEREAAISILENNLFGLDIDDRAYQLAYFAVMMKARSYNRRILGLGLSLNNLVSIQETNDINQNLIDEVISDTKYSPILNYLLEVFKDAKEIGSLFSINSEDYDALISYLEVYKDNEQLNLSSNDLLNRTLPLVINLAKQANILSRRYKVVCTNPPYLGKMEGNLKKFVTDNYKDYSGDLFSVFMYRNFNFLEINGYSGFMTPFAWMFIKTYEKLRQYIINNKSITTLVQMEYSAFEEATVPICSFIFKNGLENSQGVYIKLSQFKGGMDIQKKMVLRALENKTCDYLYENDMNSYTKVPGYPISYWVNPQIIQAFKQAESLDHYADVKKGLDTGNNERFLRFWFEVDPSTTNFSCNSREDASASNKKWFPCNKGGSFRKWYGNNEYIIDWYKDGLNMRSTGRATIRSPQYYFRSGITWSTISSAYLGMRFSPNGFIFETAGNMMFLNENLYYILGFLCSKLPPIFMECINPTITTTVGSIATLPILFNKTKLLDIESLVKENVSIARTDWNNFENSWEFKSHPFIHNTILLRDAYLKWENSCNKQFSLLKLNEEQLNEIFIEIYGLEDELTPIVEDKDITIRKADRDRDIKSFISYAVGCMMGRYSLDEEGLIYAGGEFDESKYQTFKADEDGIILISDTEYFEDDLLNRFVEFVKVVYGEETLEENLNFIADTECFKRKPTENARDCLRRYFLKGFMEDHLKVYQKRPIYWMFDSGKQNGFKALIYMHRYNEDMVAKVRTDYLHPLQRKYEAELERLDYLINFNNMSAAEKGKVKKRQEQIHKQLDECTQYDLLLAHVAHQRIPLDLDDGVKVNYQKFQNIELSAEGTSKAKKGDLLYKVKM